MNNAQTWRTLLGDIIMDPHERERIAQELDVHPMTLSRWVRGESDPRPHNLFRLLEALPQYAGILRALIGQEFPALLSASGGNGKFHDIAATFYEEILDLATETPQELLLWTIGQLILQHAITHLDPYRKGIAIVIEQCMPPANGDKIRSLRVSMSVGTPPWSERVEEQCAFLGAESLSGYVTATGHVAVIQDIADDHSRLPVQKVEHMAGVMVYPLKRAERSAGCLWVASAQTDAFTPVMQRLIRYYGNLLTLAFESEEFYRPQDFALCVMPPLQEQIPTLAGLRDRIASIMDEAASCQQLRYRKARQIAWQQLEEALIQQVVAMPDAEALSSPAKQ